MKKTSWKYRLLPILLLGLALIAMGCAGREPRPAPVTIQQILDMNQAGFSSEEIIAEIRESRAVYRLSAEKVEELKDRGVPEDVILYMQQSSRKEMDRRERTPTPAGPGLWYGGTPSGWPYAR